MTKIRQKTQDKPKLITYKPPRAEIRIRNLFRVSLRTRNPLDLIWIIGGGLILVCGAMVILVQLYEDSSYVDEFNDICYLGSTLTCIIALGLLMLWGGLIQAVHMSGLALWWFKRRYKKARKH